MPKVYKKRRTRRPYHPHRHKRRNRSWLSYIALACFICVCILLSWPGLFKSTSEKDQEKGHEIVHSQHYSVIGKPSIDPAHITTILQHYHSPASGAGQAMYDQGLKYGIDPAYALAFFMEESTFGTRGIARVTHSLGNIRATPGYRSYHGYRSYNTWTEGIDDWYRLIDQLYIKRWGLTTVDQIIPIYAPYRDHNNEAAYIHNVKQAVDTWRSGFIEI